MLSFRSKPKDTKKVKKPTFDVIDDELWQWFQLQHSKDIPISTQILLEKAYEIAKRNGNEVFKANMSWVWRFKQRHSIVHTQLCGESKSADDIAAENWLLNTWPSLNKRYDDKDIFNGDETGLFYKMLPTKSLKIKGENRSGGKKQKERLSLWLCASMAGEKMDPLIIGKSKSPRCFKNVDLRAFNYKSNRNAWMTSDIFKSMLLEWDRKLRCQGRKILLLVDNCSSHPNISADLTHIELSFLPPNTTSLLQPMDAGIIRTFKHYYRKSVLTKLIHHFDESNDNDKFSINVLDALKITKNAWCIVKESTIINCFKHAGFLKGVVEDEITRVVEDEAILQSYLGEDFNFEDYVDVDKKLETEDLEENANDEPNESVLTEEALPKITVASALNALDQLNQFYSQNAPNSELEKCLAMIEFDLHGHFMKQKGRQLKITDFLVKRNK